MATKKMMARIKKPSFKVGDRVTAKTTGARGVVFRNKPFSVVYTYKKKTYAKQSNPKYWKKG